MSVAAKVLNGDGTDGAFLNRARTLQVVEVSRPLAVTTRSFGEALAAATKIHSVVKTSVCSVVSSRLLNQADVVRVGQCRGFNPAAIPGDGLNGQLVSWLLIGVAVYLFGCRPRSVPSCSSVSPS